VTSEDRQQDVDLCQRCHGCRDVLAAVAQGILCGRDPSAGVSIGCQVSLNSLTFCFPEIRKRRVTVITLKVFLL